MLSSLSVLAAAYGALAFEQLVRGWLGTWAGVTWGGFGLTDLLTPVIRQSGAPATPLGWLALLVGGPVLLLLAAFVVFTVVNAFRASGVVRSLVLSLVVVGAVWLPTQLFAAAVPQGRGPIAELYAALGDPRAGRWGAAALGALLLWLVAGPVSRRAVATGRSWMRADGREFRRRLTRVVAAYPAALVMLLIATALAWMPPLWAAVWAAMVFVTLMLRTA